MELQLDTIDSQGARGIFIVESWRYTISSVYEDPKSGPLSLQLQAAKQDESWLELLHIENQSGHKNYPSIHWAEDIQYWYLPMPAAWLDYNFPLYIDDQL